MINFRSENNGKVEESVVQIPASTRMIYQGDNSVTALETRDGVVYRIVLQPDNAGYYREIQIVPLEGQYSLNKQSHISP